MFFGAAQLGVTAQAAPSVRRRSPAAWFTATMSQVQGVFTTSHSSSRSQASSARRAMQPQPHSTPGGLAIGSWSAPQANRIVAQMSRPAQVSCL